MTTLTARDLQDLHTRLEERAAALRNERAALESERSGAPTLLQDTVDDDAEKGEHRARDAVRDVEQERDASELREIAAAMARMDEGTYGLCVECGREIQPARLQAQPAAARCIPCQQRFERVHPPALRVTLLP
jgi:RNA polymerase-binding transcription factor